MEDHNPTDLAAPERKQREAKDRNKLAQDGEIEDIKWLMGSKRGRRIVYRLLDQAGVFRISFNTNAMQMAFNEGNRNYGNKVLALITSTCPTQYAELLNEAKPE